MATDEPAALTRTLAQIENIAVEAGRILLEGWDRDPLVEFKSTDHDLVTEFDRRAEACIVEQLRARFPEDAIVGEEGAAVAARESRHDGSDSVWYVDPLDGTVNFAHGLPLFGVSIGLHRAGRPIVGVVYAPALGFTFTGGPGLGSFRNGRPIRPSRLDRLDRALLVTGFPTARPARANNQPAFLAFNAVAEGVRRLGSAALDLCFVACGWLDGTWQRSVHPWDTVGGAAIVLGAGGTITNLDGTVFDPLSGGVVASNGLIQSALEDLLRTTGTRPTAY
jgi:myo-inositol-1(or 4)-monophosphatase